MGDLCVSYTCKCVNASIGTVHVEHWMCGESWLATKDRKPTIPSSQGWASSVHFNFLVTLFLYGLIICYYFNVCLCVHACGFLSRRGCLYIYVCMCFSKPSRLPVYIYDCMHPCTAYHKVR